MSDIEKKLLSLEEIKAKVAAARDANQALAEKAAEGAEGPRLLDELAYEGARAKAYTDPAVGPARVVGGEIKGAGFVLLRWPDAINYVYFVNKGILKPNGLTSELCRELVCRCVLYPAIDPFKTILERNPGAAVALATKLLEGMNSEALEGGKE